MATLAVLSYLLSLLPAAFWWGVGVGMLILGTIYESLAERRRKREQNNQKSAG